MHPLPEAQSEKIQADFSNNQRKYMAVVDYFSQIIEISGVKRLFVEIGKLKGNEGDMDYANNC